MVVGRSPNIGMFVTKYFVCQGFRFPLNAESVIYLTACVTVSQQQLRPGDDRAFTLIILHLLARCSSEDGK